MEILENMEIKNCVSAFNKLYFYIDVEGTRIWVHPDLIKMNVKVIKHKNYLRKVNNCLELENSVLVKMSEKEYLLYFDDHYYTIVLKVDDEKVEVQNYNSSDLTVRQIKNLIFITTNKTSTPEPEILLIINDELYYIDIEKKKLRRVYSDSLPPSSFGIKEDLYSDMVEYGASRGVPVYMKEFIKDDAEDSEDIEYEESVDY